MIIRTKNVLLLLLLTAWTMQTQAVGPELDLKRKGKVEISKLAETLKNLNTCQTKEDLLEMRLLDETGLTWFFSKIDNEFVLKAQHINLPTPIATFIKKNPKVKIYLRADGHYTTKKELSDVICEVHVYHSIASDLIEKLSKTFGKTDIDDKTTALENKNTTEKAADKPTETKK